MMISFRSALMGAAACCGTANAAYAQLSSTAASPSPIPTPSNTAASESSGLSDIVVTARRRAENLQDVPVAISAVSGLALAKQGVFKTQDLSSSTPNLQVNSVYGDTQPNFTIRGVGVGNVFDSNAASPIGIYVDDVYQATRASHGQQLYDIERVEILRGPQGTLYGRNTTGGAINFITRQPSLASGVTGYATIGYGNYSRVSAQAALEDTLIPDVLGVRLAGTYVNSKPYVKNLSGPDSGAPEEYGFRGIVRLKPADGVDLSLKAYASRTKGGQENLIDANATPDNTGPITFGPIGQAFGLTYDRHDLPNDKVEADGAGYALIKTSGVVFKGIFDLASNLKLTSISGYDQGRYSQLPGTDCDGSPLDLCHVGYDSKFQGFNQELRLNLDLHRLKVVGGLYYGWDRIDVRNTYRLYEFLDGVRQEFGLPATYFNPAGFGVIADPTALPTPINADTQYDQTRRSRAVFGEGVYDLTNKLSFTLGLRYTKDSDHYYDGLATLYDQTGAARLVSVSAVDGLVPAGPDVTPLELERRTGALSGRAIVSYKPVKDVMVYASYSRGYRSGAFNGTAFQNNEQVNYAPPEKVAAYEGGIKSRFFDNKVQFNASFFYYDYRHQQVQAIVGDRSLTALGSVNGKVKGLEFEIDYKPVRALTLSLSGGYLDSKYNANQFIAGINVGGNNFAFAPKESFNGSFDWIVTELGRGTVNLHGDASYTGRYAYDPFGNRQATGVLAKGGGNYALLNGRLSYDTDRYSVAVFAKNITGTFYYPYMLNLEAGYGIDGRIRSAPRTFGVEGTYRF